MPLYNNRKRQAKAYCDGRAAAAAGATYMKATATTGVEESDNALTWTAAVDGGDNLVVRLIDPGEDNADLSVSVLTPFSGEYEVLVSLETDGTGDIASTAAEVDAAVDALPAAAALVTPSNTGDSDGCGVVEADVVRLSGSDFPYIYLSTNYTNFVAGFASWSADPDGVPGDDCADAYGGGFGG